MILHNWFETLEDIQKGRGEKTKEKGQKMPEKELGKRDVKQEIELIEDKEQEIEEIILSKTETPLEDQVHLTEKEIGEIILSKTETPLEDQVHLTEEEIKKIILSEIPLEDQVYITEESMKTLLSIFTSDPKHDSSHILGEDGTRKKAALWYVQGVVIKNKLNGSTQEKVAEKMKGETDGLPYTPGAKTTITNEGKE